MNLQVIPQALTDAAGNLAAIGSSLTEANAAAALPTTTILPAAADEVSAAISELFGVHGQVWQQVAAAAEEVHQQFVQLLQAAANLYQEAEDANAESMLQPGYTVTGTWPHTKIVDLPGVFNQPVGQGQDLLHISWGGSAL